MTPKFIQLHLGAGVDTVEFLVLSIASAPLRKAASFSVVFEL